MSRIRSKRRSSIAARLGFGFGYQANEDAQTKTPSRSRTSSTTSDIRKRLTRSTSVLAVETTSTADEEFYEFNHDEFHFFRVAVTTLSTTSTTTSFEAHVMLTHDGLFRTTDRSTCKLIHELRLSDIIVIDYQGGNTIRNSVSVQFSGGLSVDLDFETSKARVDFCTSVRELRSVSSREKTRSGSQSTSVPRSSRSATGDDGGSGNVAAAVPAPAPAPVNAAAATTPLKHRQLSKLLQNQSINSLSPVMIKRLTSAITLVDRVETVASGSSSVNHVASLPRVEQRRRTTFDGSNEEVTEKNSKENEAEDDDKNEEKDQDEDEDEDALTSSTRYEDLDEDWLEPFYVMEINKYGFYEPRLFNIR